MSWRIIFYYWQNASKHIDIQTPAYVFEYMYAILMYTQPK